MRIRCRSALIISDPGTRVSTKGQPLRTSSDVFPISDAFFFSSRSEVRETPGVGANTVNPVKMICSLVLFEVL